MEKHPLPQYIIQHLIIAENEKSIKRFLRKNACTMYTDADMSALISVKQLTYRYTTEKSTLSRAEGTYEMDGLEY